MKKITYLIAGLTALFFWTNPVDAMTFNNDGTMVNSRGAIITSEQYQKLLDIYSTSENKEMKIDYLEPDQVEFYTSPNTNITKQEEYFITTYTLDRFGNVVNTRTIPASKEDTERVSENSNLYVMPNGTLQDISKMAFARSVIDGSSYETAGKKLELHYANNSTDYEISMYVDWKTVPKVKSFDVIAFRTENNLSNNITYYTAWQRSDVGETFYGQDGTNTKIGSNGIGVSMNLYDNATEPETIYLRVRGNKSYGKYIYATYQHAVSNISLATSQSYTFGSSGLGGVLQYSNGYSKYFDNMAGLKTSYTN